MGGFASEAPLRHGLAGASWPKPGLAQPTGRLPARIFCHFQVFFRKSEQKSIRENGPMRVDFQPQRLPSGTELPSEAGWLSSPASELSCWLLQYGWLMAGWPVAQNSQPRAGFEPPGLSRLRFKPPLPVSMRAPACMPACNHWAK